MKTLCENKQPWRVRCAAGEINTSFAELAIETDKHELRNGRLATDQYRRPSSRHAMASFWPVKNVCLAKIAAGESAHRVLRVTYASSFSSDVTGRPELPYRVSIWIFVCMYMYVCMYLCIYVCMYVYVCIDVQNSLSRTLIFFHNLVSFRLY